MPMFYTPKPRQFHYSPRLYDPEKEEWEMLKAKYCLENGLPLDDNEYVKATAGTDADLAYYQRRVRELDRKDRAEKQKLKASDLFRKRERPQFHYVSRFDENGNLIETPVESREPMSTKRIKRRFEDDDLDRIKPVPASKIIIYTLAVIVLLAFVVF